MYLFLYAGDEYTMPIAVSKDRAKLLKYAKKYIVEGECFETIDPSDLRLKWRACEDGEYAIENKHDGTIYGWIDSAIKEVK